MPSSAVTVYTTGLDKSCASPEAGEAIADSETENKGEISVRSVPNGTVI